MSTDSLLEELREFREKLDRFIALHDKAATPEPKPSTIIWNYDPRAIIEDSYRSRMALDLASRPEPSIQTTGDAMIVSCENDDDTYEIYDCVIRRVAIVPKR